MKHNGRGIAFADVLQGGDLQRTIPQSLDPREVRGRVVEHQRVRLGTNRHVLALFLETVDHAGRRRDMPSCRAAASSDPLGVDTEFGGVLSHPADSRLPVRHAFEWRGAMAVAGPVLGADRHHPA